MGNTATSLLARWRRSGEPVLLALLGLLTFTTPLLVLLELVTARQGLRGMLVLIWLSGGLLLTRLPQLLRQERRRVLLLATTGGAALLATLALGSAVAPLASPALAAVAGQPEPSIEQELSPQRVAVAPLLASLAAPVAQATPTPSDAQTTPEPLTFVSPPRISRQVFASILARGTSGPSPTAPIADELYDIIISYGLDPAVALAFFAKESEFGVTGAIGRENTKNWGATRGAYNGQRMVDKIMVNGKPFVRYLSWQDGLKDWCELILNRYVARGLDTVEKAVPVYAPTTDGNDPNSYIDGVRRRVAIWQGRDPDPPQPKSSRVYGDNLELALMTETFEAAGMEYHAAWAFHRYALDEARAGRPLGSPLNESRLITVGGKQYAVQTFAADTLYTPLASVEQQTNWSDVRRMSTLMKQSKP